MCYSAQHSQKGEKIHVFNILYIYIKITDSIISVFSIILLPPK